MDTGELLATLATRGVDVVTYFYRAATTPREAEKLAASLGMSAGIVRKRARLGAEWVGNKANAQALELARQEGLSLDVLEVIHAAVGKLNRGSRVNLRLELTQVAVRMTVDELRVHANARVAELNGPANRSRRYLRFSATTGADGLRYAMLCLPENEMAHVERVVNAKARSLRELGMTFQQAAADALVALLAGGGEDNPWRQPAVVMTMDDVERCVDADHLFVTSDGTQITAREYAEQKLAPYGLTLLYDKDGHMVDMFRMSRFANDKQRAMITLDQILCVHPGCTRPVRDGQFHHVKAWKNGGETNIDNLVGACASHNAQNDDDRDGPNGHYVRDDGRAGWVPPEGGPTKFNTLPAVQKSAGAWAASKTTGL